MNKKVIDIINDCHNIDLEINDEVLVINFFCEKQNNMDINIIQNNNSKLYINYSSFVQNDTIININVLVKGDNNITNVIVHSIANKGYGQVFVNIKNENNTKNNLFKEDLKGLNEEGSICFMPMLEIFACDVDASHFASVGSFDEEKLFYLQTKGLDKKDALVILKNNFIYNIFSLEFQKKIRKDIYE